MGRLRPVLFEGETRAALRAVSEAPAGGNIGESSSQRVLRHVVYQGERVAIVAVERIDTHSPPGQVVDVGEPF